MASDGDNAIRIITANMIEKVKIITNPSAKYNAEGRLWHLNPFLGLRNDYNRYTGFELNGRYSVARWLSFRGNFNYNYFDSKGIFETQNFDFTGKR